MLPRRSHFLALGLLILTTSVSAETCLQDVRASFQNVNEKVTPLMTWTNDVFKLGSYRQLLKTRFGLDNHIQGIVRVPGTSTFVLSGGDRYIKEANLFLVNFPDAENAPTLNKNFSRKDGRDAAEADGFVKKIDVGSKDFWHAGGIAILDKLLVIPVENPKTKSSKIIFFDMTDALNPEKLDVEIVRSASTTGSVLVRRNENGKIIVGGNVDGVMEFFESKTDDIRDGFMDGSKMVYTEAKGQGVDIVSQCDGKLFLIDFNNSSKFAPIIYGKNFVSLFSLDLASGASELLEKRTLDTGRNCNFKAAGSHHITSDGKLVFYGSSFYRHWRGKQFKMCQFSED